MANLRSARFSLDFKLLRVSAEIAEDDRQCAWEFYTEMNTRVAVTGKRGDPDGNNFDGEIYIESLNSLYTFFKESRALMRRFPMGKIEINKEANLGIMIDRVMSIVLRPFLEKWQGRFRYWWDVESDHTKPFFERQKEFPELEEMLSEWSDLRRTMKTLNSDLLSKYQLIPLER